MEYARVPMQETWQAMEKLADNGNARNIGLCNVNTQGLRDLLNYARIPPAVLQVERHAYLQQSKLLRMCREEVRDGADTRPACRWFYPNPLASPPTRLRTPLLNSPSRPRASR